MSDSHQPLLLENTAIGDSLKELVDIFETEIKNSEELLVYNANEDETVSDRVNALYVMIQ